MFGLGAARCEELKDLLCHCQESNSSLWKACAQMLALSTSGEHLARRALAGGSATPDCCEHTQLKTQVLPTIAEAGFVTHPKAVLKNPILKRHFEALTTNNEGFDFPIVSWKCFWSGFFFEVGMVSTVF